MQRLRIGFSRTGAIRFLSHLEMMRMWERALRRARWRLLYSQGFHPHPKISLAAPLAVGVASECELLEVYLEEPRPVDEAARELFGQMPQGVEVRSVEEVPVDAPPLQRLLTASEYRVVCPSGISLDDVRRGAARLLAADSLPRERAKEGRVRSYDLRPMIRSLEAENGGGRPVLWMVLRADAQGAGRPDEVLKEMGLDPADCEITRTRLLLG